MSKEEAVRGFLLLATQPVIDAQGPDFEVRENPVDPKLAGLQLEYCFVHVGGVEVRWMDLAELFSHYGYLMLLVGSLGEGMPIMLFGGFAAHRGWLALIPWVILIGAIGNALAQCAWFFGARYAGHRILEKRVDWAANVERVDRLLKKWEAPVVIGARFIPGFSSTTTIAVALSAMSSMRFLALNSIGALAWALTFGILGYVLGQAIEGLLGDIGRYERPVAVGLLVAAVIWMVWHHAQTFRSRSRSRGDIS